MELKILREFITNLDNEKSSIERAMVKCQNPIRYLELKTAISTQRVVLKDLEELFIEESNKELEVKR